MTDRTAWLEWRRGGIGGSDIAALLGLSPWTSPWALWADKVGLTPHDDQGSEAMEFGQRVEPVLTRWFADRTGLHVAGEQMECTHPAEPWMRCTVDGFVFEADQGDTDTWSIDCALGVAEWKSTGDGPWDDIPAYYQAQAQWNMAVTGMSACWFGVLHLPFGRPTFRVYELARDESDIDYMIDVARRFWHDHVIAGTPPEVDASEATAKALGQAFDPDDDETIDADLTLTSDLTVLARLKADAKQLESEISGIENRIKAAMGTATAIVDGFDDKGKPKVLATWREGIVWSGLDGAALKEAHPDIHAKFYKSTIGRKFLLKLKGGS